MYCSSCGVAVAETLSYCNYCGAKLNGVNGDNSFIKLSEAKPDALVNAMVAVFVCGLGAIIGLMAVMKAVLELNDGVILAFALLSFLIMLLLEGVFVRLLLRRTRGIEQAGNTVRSKGQATKELDATEARALPEPVPSVTEHTTRVLDPIYNERTSE